MATAPAPSGSGEAPSRRLRIIKHRLLALDYQEPLGIESLDLVERLLEDLVKTTESFRGLQDHDDRLSQDLALVQAQILPLRKTISRLTRENNELHGRMIRQAEEEDKSVGAFRRDVGELEAQLHDIRFLTAQKDAKINDQSSRIEELTQKLTRLLHDHPKGGANVKSLDITAELPPPPPRPSNSPIPPTSGDDQTHAMVIQGLERQVTSLLERTKELEADNDRLSTSLKIREDEMRRLGRELESDMLDGPGTDRLALQAALTSNQKIVDQLNSQIDFLNQELAVREGQLQAVLDKEVQNSREARKALQSSLGQVQKENARLTSRLRVVEEELLAAKAAAGTQEEEPESRPAPHVCPAETESGELGRVKEALREAEEARRRAESLLDDMAVELRSCEAQREEARKELGEQRVLAQRLQKELDAVKTRSEVLERRSKAHDEVLQDMARKKGEDRDVVERLRDEMENRHQMKEREMAELELEAATLTGQKEDLLGMLKAAHNTMAQLTDDCNEAEKAQLELTGKVDSLQRELQAAKDAITKLENERSDGSGNVVHVEVVQDLAHRLDDERTKREEAERTLVDVQQELLQFKTEGQRLEAALAEAKTRELYDHQQGSQETGTKDASYWKQQAQQAQAQRDVLQSALEECQKVRTELESLDASRRAALRAGEEEKKDLLTQLGERDHAYQTLLSKARALEADLHRLKSVRAERESALASRELSDEGKDREIDRLQNEINRLTAALTADQNRQIRAGQRVDGLEGDLSSTLAELRSLRETHRAQAHELDTIKASLSMVQVDKRELVLELERTRRDLVREREVGSELRAQADAGNEELLRRDEQISQLKALFKQLHSGREQLNKKLEMCYEQISRLEAKERQKAEEAKAWERKVQERQDEIDRMSKVLAELDEERDALHAALDQQQEASAGFQRERGTADRNFKRIEADLEEEQQRVKSLTGALASKDKETRTLQGKVAGLTHEIAETRKALQARMLELKAVNEDLQMMTRENQVANGELAMVSRERDEVKLKLESVMTRSAKAEQLLRVSQIEKDDLLASYRAVCEERKRLESGIDDLSKARTRLSKALDESQMELGHVRASLLTVETELSRRVAEVAALDRQVETLSRQLAAAQRKLDLEESDKKRMALDLDSQRQVAGTRVEVLKTLEARAASSTEEVAVARARIANLERERETLARMMAEERTHGLELERIIASARAREAIQSKELAELNRINLQLREALRRQDVEPGATSAPSASPSIFRTPAPELFTPEQRRKLESESDSRDRERDRADTSNSEVDVSKEEEDEHEHILESYLSDHSGGEGGGASS